MSTLPFSPLASAELTDRARSHAFMAVGALTAWADGSPGGPEPTVAIWHARLVAAYHDAEDARDPR